MKTLFPDLLERLIAFVAVASIALEFACFFGGLAVLVFFDATIGTIVSLCGPSLFGAIALLSIFLLARHLREEVREALGQ